MENTQILLIGVVTVLTALLAIIGFQVFLILREIKKTIEATFDANEFELLEFLNNARAFEEYFEQLEGAISEDNQLYHATWKGLSVLIEILEELQSDQ